MGGVFIFLFGAVWVGDLWVGVAVRVVVFGTLNPIPLKSLEAVTIDS